MVRLRPLMFGIALLLGVAMVAACGSSSTSTTTSAARASAPATSAPTTSAGGGVTVTTAAGGTTVSIAVSDTKGTDGPETLVPSVSTAKAGDITFQVKNTGTIDHEVVVLKTDTAFDQLPVGTPEADKVDESSSIGESGDPALKPGESRSFTITDVVSAKYVFVCNIAKHYGLGMRAAFNVT
jgi:uncharacterized cupredoxin-like copper-binding protein